MNELLEKISGKHLISNELMSPSSGKTFDVVNPATNEVFAKAAAGNAKDVGRAVAAAKSAQVSWAQLSVRERSDVLLECASKISLHVEEIAKLLALETGKAIRTECRAEPALVATTFRFYGGLVSEIKGETVPFNTETLVFTKREPLGVVAVIIPWNVPLVLMAYKVAPALAAGNTVVIKSSENAPLAVLRTCQLLSEVLPAGVLNILSGEGSECGGPLTEHPDVSKITFTGSVEVGKIVSAAAATRFVPVTLELGGKSPMIVMKDADLERAVDGAISGMRFTRQGQSCTAASRMLVHKELHDTFINLLVEKVDALKIGDPLEESTDIGSLISKAQYEKVKRYIAIGEATPGITSYHCSHLPKARHLKNGFFIQPVIFANITNDHQLAREEIFGPVACVISFSEFEEAIDIANDSTYGLAATIWTQDIRAALQAVDKLEAGFVQVNQNMVAQPGLSYGGFKASGIGKEASLEAMLDHFTRKKTVLMNMT